MTVINELAKKATLDYIEHLMTVKGSVQNLAWMCEVVNDLQCRIDVADNCEYPVADMLCVWKKKTTG